MAEDADKATFGWLLERRKLASNLVDKLTHEHQAAKNALEDAQLELSGIEAMISHVRTKPGVAEKVGN
jgi:hypothetical protein